MPRILDNILIFTCLVFVAIVLAWSMVGSLLSLTLGQVLVVALAGWVGWWLRGQREERERQASRRGRGKLKVVK
jgi:hypothetical protein